MFESGNVFKGKGERLKNSLPDFALLGSPLGSSQQNKNVSKEKIFFEGMIVRNRTIKYKIKIGIQSSNPLIPNELKIFSGIGIINKNMDAIKVAEIDEGNNLQIYELSKG